MHLIPSISGISQVFCLLATGAAWSADLGFHPLALDFGSPALRESKRLQVKLRNASAADIGLTGAAIEGSGAAAFRIAADTCGALLAAGANCSYSIVYQAPALTPQTAQLRVRADGQPDTVLSLSGNRYPARNDTGLTLCVSPEGIANGVFQPCPGADYPGQDGDTGRDKTRNYNGNGEAGFNFTKLDGQGRPLAAAAKNWKCVRDNVTGLIWEVKPPSDAIQANQGPHDADDTYTWYSTDSGNNGGDPGEANPAGSTCTGYNATDSLSWCNTENYVYRTNRAGYCGFQDWRMPSRPELAELEHLGNLRIDTGYFPDTGRDYWETWTSSPYALGSDRAWSIDFRFAISHPGLRGESRHARLVRGERQAFPSQ
jgi:hypothetical protein